MRCLRSPAAVGLALLLAWLPASRAQDAADPFREAKEHLNAGRADEVVAAVTGVLEAHPADGNLHVIGSQLMREALRPELALAAARKAVSLLPEDPGARRQLARLMLDVSVSIDDPDERQEAVEAALAGFGEAAALTPDSTEYLVEWAQVLVRTHRNEDAVGVWKRVLALDGDLVEAQIGLARLLAAVDRWEELLELASRAKDASPDMAWRVALYAYDEAVQEKKYDVADSFLPLLRAAARGDSREFGVKALGAIAGHRREQSRQWTAKYLATNPDPEEAEVVYNAVVDRGLGDIPPPKRLPARRRPLAPNGDVALPEVVKKYAPYYPPALESSGIEGKVVVHAVVRTDGTIGRVRVSHSTHPYFTIAALDAVKQWHYLPAIYKGQPVAIYYTIRLDFRPKHQPPPPRKKK